VASPFRQAVSGDDALAFAAAFYSPDHPYYKRPFQAQYTWGMPRRTTLDKGWAGMCFQNDPICLDWLNRVAKVAGSIVRIEFDLQANLWGQPGVTTKIAALITPPYKEPAIKPVDQNSGSIEDFSANRRHYSDNSMRHLR
jgi:hypothetical protein